MKQVCMNRVKYKNTENKKRVKYILEFFIDKTILHELE